MARLLREGSAVAGNVDVPSRVNVPNALTTLRLCSTPVLLWLAWHGESEIFVCVFVAGLFSDLIDGTLARWLKQTSQFGSLYDSLADASVYLALPICAYWLEPDFVVQEVVFVCAVIACYLTPLVLSLLRFRRLPSLHTLSSKGSAVVLGGAIVLVFLGGSYLPFRIGAVLYVLVAIEEGAIIFLLPEWRTNVPTLYHALAYRRHKARG